MLSQNAKSNRNVRDFYKILDLENETRRIDFLLINIIGLIKRLEKNNNDIYIINKLKEIKDTLFQKRKFMSN